MVAEIPRSIDPARSNSMSRNSSAAATNFARPTSRWWQFSLLNLLLVAVIVCVLAGYFGSRQEMAQANRKVQEQKLEIDDLREQIGIIPVEDESKILVQARSNPFDEDPFHWRWRVHLPQLPAGESWVFMIQKGDLQDSNVDPLLTGVGSRQLSGQIDLDVVVERDLDGSAKLSLTGQGRRRGIESSTPLSEEEVQSLRRLVQQRSVQIAGRTLVVASLEEKVELLRIAPTEQTGEKSGLLIYLERSNKRPP